MDHQTDEFNFHSNTFAEYDFQPWLVDQKICDNLMSVEQVECLLEMESALNDFEESFVGTSSSSISLKTTRASDSDDVMVNLPPRGENTNVPYNLSAILENTKQVLGTVDLCKQTSKIMSCDAPVQELLLDASASLDVAQRDYTPLPPTAAVVFKRTADPKKSNRSRSRTISGKNVQASPRKARTKAKVQSSVPKPTKKKKSPEPFVLPQGWDIDYKVRKKGILKGYLVKYYLEPDLGDVVRKRFKSLPEVKFYIEHGYRRPVNRSKRRKVDKGSSKPAASSNPDAFNDEDIHIFARELEADMILSSGLFEDDDECC